jgi:4-hydroxy-4-methyl-2-oxoglutarate aldolase
MTANALPKSGVLTPGQLEHLRTLSTCVVASAIEMFDVRLPNTGFIDSSIRCIFDDIPPMAGYAATVRIRTAAPPMEGGRYSYARTDWWDHLLAIPSPRIMVIEDMDTKPGLGAFVGEVYANILQALGCVGLVTNGAVRDLREVQKTGFQMFAGNVSISHAYAHVFDFGGPVELGGLKIRPGDLLHGDLNGVQCLPLAIMNDVLTATEEIIRKRRALTGLCRSSDFSVDKLREGVKAEIQPKVKKN